MSNQLYNIQAFGKVRTDIFQKRELFEGNDDKYEFEVEDEWVEKENVEEDFGMGKKR